MIRKGLWVFSALSLVIFSCKTRKIVSPVTQEVPAEVRDLFYDAEAAFLAGNTTEALAQFNRYVKISPKPAPGYYRLACLDANAGKTEEALSHIKQAIQADTSNPYYRIYQADLLQRKRDYLNAGNAYMALALKYPSRWSFYVDAARMYKYAGDYEKVLQLCTPWEKAFGLREDVAVAKSEACMQLKRYDEGFTVWSRLMERYPYRKNYRVTYAAMLGRAGWTDSAARVYEYLLKDDPQNPELLTSLCTYYQTTGNLARLWEHSKIAVASEQLDIWKKHSCLVPFLNDFNENKYYDSLEVPLKLMTTLHPQDHRSWLFLSDWYYARKQYSKAIDGFSRTLSLFAGDFRVWSKYTECLDRTAGFSRLTRVADSMAELFPSNPTVELIAASAYEGIADWEKAEEHCRTGLVYAADEDMIVALKVSLARVLNATGNMADAETLLIELKNSYPRNTEVLNGYARFLSTAKGKYQDALTLADEAISVTPKSEYYFTRAGIYSKIPDKYPEALLDIQKAIAQDRQGKYLVFYGDMLFAAGKKSEAMIQWKSAWDEGYIHPDLKKKIAVATP